MAQVIDIAQFRRRAADKPSADQVEALRLALQQQAPADRELSRWAGHLLNRPLLRTDTGKHGRATDVRRFDDQLCAKFWTRDAPGEPERHVWVSVRLLTPEHGPKVPA